MVIEGLGVVLPGDRGEYTEKKTLTRNAHQSHEADIVA